MPATCSEAAGQALPSSERPSYDDLLEALRKVVLFSVPAGNDSCDQPVRRVRTQLVDNIRGLVRRVMAASTILAGADTS